MSELPSQITSTLQRMAQDLADTLQADFALTDPVPVLDLDDFFNIADETTGQAPATVVQFLSCAPADRDPFYTAVFVIGFKVGGDSAGIRMSKAIDRIFRLLQTGAQFDVKDYMVPDTTDMEAAPVTGVLTVVESSLLDQTPEVNNLLRLYAVTCKCLNLQ